MASIIRMTRIGELGATLAVTNNRSTIGINAITCPPDDGETFFRNVDSYKNHMALHPRRQHSLESPSWKTQILHCFRTPLPDKTRDYWAMSLHCLTSCHYVTGTQILRLHYRISVSYFQHSKPHASTVGTRCSVVGWDSVLQAVRSPPATFRRYFPPKRLFAYSLRGNIILL
jgi:hypothetical protein